jgi:hypothetical protein
VTRISSGLGKPDYATFQRKSPSGREILPGLCIGRGSDVMPMQCSRPPETRPPEDTCRAKLYVEAYLHDIDVRVDLEVVRKGSATNGGGTD